VSASEPDPVRIGIASVAHGHAAAYYDALAGFDDAEVAGVADDDDERGRAFADERGVDFLDAGTLFERSDAVVTCAANAHHRAWVERAADAGCDVLCEKPLATTSEDAEAAVAACDDAGVDLGVAMPLRFSEPARRAREAVRGDAIGDLQLVAGTNLLGTPSGGWITDPDLSGGGAIMDHTAHVVDLVRWITGEEVVEVFAKTGTSFPDEAFRVEDVDLASMELSDGTPFTHEGSWRQPDEWDFWGDATLKLVGSAGVFEVDCFDQAFKQTRDGPDGGIESVFWGSNPDAGLVRDFVDAVREGRPPETTGRDGVREVRVVEATYESTERGEPVRVEYPDLG